MTEPTLESECHIIFQQVSGSIAYEAHCGFCEGDTWFAPDEHETDMKGGFGGSCPYCLEEIRFTPVSTFEGVELLKQGGIDTYQGTDNG